MVSGCWPWQSPRGTKAAQSSPSPLVPLAQPHLQLGMGRGLSPEPAPGMAGSHSQQDCHAQGWGAGPWGLMLQLMSSYLGGSP